MQKKDYTNSFILNSLNLPVIKDLNSLSNKLGLTTRTVYVLSHKSSNYYNKFEIPKRNGESREINSPTFTLKIIQRWILEEILEKINVSNVSMAFKKGENSGIKKNAEIHRYSLHIMALDLEDFFLSIKRERIFYLFRSIGYNILISNILTNFCTFQGHLPQGGVCSPYLSNLVCYKLDRRLQSFCSKRDVLYTRYADDLTFSCDNKEVLKKMRKMVIKIINDEGFILNESKTRFLSPVSHKKVTGITINNGKIKASKRLKKNVRAMIHYSILTKDYNENDKIRGYISYINSIEEGYKNKIEKYISKILKRYRFLKDIVESYNENRLFESFPEQNYIDIYNKFEEDFLCADEYKKSLETLVNFLERKEINEEEIEIYQNEILRFNEFLSEIEAASGEQF